MSRPRKPTARHRLVGSYREDRHGGELELPPEVPDAPDWLGDRAREHWSRLAYLLHGMGVLTKADGLALALLCDALTDYEEAAARIRADGITVEGSQGQPRIHPAMTARHQAWERVLKVCREFGLTPATISKVRASEAPTDEPAGKGRFFRA